MPLEEIKQRANDAKAHSMAQTLSRAAKYHRAFQQNEDGRALYHGWVQELLSATPTLDPNELLRREGLRLIVKKITDNIQIINDRSEHG